MKDGQSILEDLTKKEMSEKAKEKNAFSMVKSLIKRIINYN